MNAEENREENRAAELPGRQLREARERHNLSTAQAAHELHVDEALLRALENDEYETLGAPIFVKGHLRNYARMLGLDPAVLIAAYEEMLQPADPVLQTRSSGLQRMGKGGSAAHWLRGLGTFVIVVLLVGLAGWWYYQRDSLPQDTGRLTLSVNKEPVTVETETAEEPAQEMPATPDIEFEAPVAGPETGPGMTSAAGDSADRDNAGADEAQSAGVSQDAAAQAVTPPAGNAVSAAPLQLQFREESWVEVYDAAGRPVLYDLVRAGATREINERGEVRLFFGNAPGVDIRINGKEFPLHRYIRSDNTARLSIDLGKAE